MFFYLKLTLGEILFAVRYLAELCVIYLPERHVHFGRTMRQWKRQERRRQKFIESLNEINEKRR